MLILLTKNVIVYYQPKVVVYGLLIVRLELILVVLIALSSVIFQNTIGFNSNTIVF